MPRLTWVLVLLLVGCTGANQRTGDPAAPTPAPQPAEVTAPETPAPAPEAPTSPPAPTLPACTYAREAPSVFPELQTPTTGACRPEPKAVARELQTAVRERWKRRWPDGQLEIRPGCDRLDAHLESLVIVTSGGHAGSFTVAGFQRDPGGAYDLLLLEYNHYTPGPRPDPDDPWQADRPGTLTVHRARLDTAVTTRLLDRVRAAAHVEIEERQPPPRADGTGSGSASGSSHSYHVALRLADGRGQGVQRQFAGYEASGPDQRDGVPLAIVADHLRELLADDRLRKTFAPVELTDPATRDLFARVFWAAHARGDDYGSWFVRERLLGMAALLGSHQHMPALLARLDVPGDAGVARSAILAIHAVAALTGFDVRYDADRRPRPPAQVAADTLAACTPR